MTIAHQISLIGGNGFVTEDDLKRLGQQERLILEGLNSRYGEWIPVHKLERTSGSTRVGARIYDLRQEGLLIESRRGRGGRAEYRLVGRGEKPTRKTRHACPSCECEGA